MKRSCLLLFCALIGVVRLLAQENTISIMDGMAIHSWNHLSGETDCALIFNKVWYNYDFTYRRIVRDKISLAGSLSFQKEQVHFNESDAAERKFPYTLILDKYDRWFNISTLAGFISPLGSSPFCFLANAGMGFGLRKNESVNADYSYNGWIEIIENNGSHLDSIHSYYDGKITNQNAIASQVLLQSGFEFRYRRISCITLLQFDQWMSAIDKVEYHSEHEDNYYFYNSVCDGDFKVRTGHLVLKAGFGYLF